MIRSRTEPERHQSPHQQLLPASLAPNAARFQTVFTQSHLDTALYGYDSYNRNSSTSNETTVSSALSGLRSSGLNYGTSFISIYRVFQKKSTKFAAPHFCNRTSQSHAVFNKMSRNKFAYTTKAKRLNAAVKYSSFYS